MKPSSGGKRSEKSQCTNNWNFEDFKLYESLSLRFGFRTWMEEGLWPEVRLLFLFSWYNDYHYHYHHHYYYHCYCQKCSCFLFSPDNQLKLNRSASATTILCWVHGIKSVSEHFQNTKSLARNLILIYLASWCLATTSWKCSRRLGKSISSMNFFFLCLHQQYSMILGSMIV